MKIHTQIRTEIVELLSNQLGDIEYIYNGQPTFIDIEEEQLAVAVYLDEINAENITLCHEQWTAQLNISIYLKATEDAETELDDWAEQIRTVISNQQAFDTIDDINLSQYRYEYDQNQRTWFNATLVYQIEYNSNS